MKNSVNLHLLRFSVVKITALILLFSSASFAQYSEPYRKGKMRSRISVAPVKTFYKNDPHMTTGTKSKVGFDASYKSEIFWLKKTNLILGLDYFNYGLTFHGYYAKPGFTYLFDESFAYTHEIRIQELQLPIALKVTFNSEKEYPVSAYFIGGVGARFIIASYSVISNDSTGITVYDAKDNIDYENQRVAKGLNAFYHLGLGLQHNY
ncbi:MAG: outer membrane beta-barrel protein, partial [Bacteroidia bacterium]